MQRIQSYSEKILNFTYDEYVRRGESLQNLVIDKYVIYEKIGRGSSGEVYKGMDDTTKKLVAVKLLNLREINSEQKITVKLIKQRLCESQPRLMQQCSSPYLLKCYDIYRNQDLKILILEYCNGQTLQQEINQKRRIPQKQAVEIIKHIINGLMELHRNKIIHRDLKAQNIISHNGTYKIIDFGFSKKLETAQQNAQIRGTALGTITTMAPQVMSKRPYGLKADIWSLGIIFFQMIYGIYPYDSLSAFQLYKQIREKQLFSKKTPLVINGFQPSRESYQFIKFLIVFDTSQRPNWQQVSQHPLIKRQNDQMNQRFIKKAEVIVQKGFEQIQQYQKNNKKRSIGNLFQQSDSQEERNREQTKEEEFRYEDYINKRKQREKEKKESKKKLKTRLEELSEIQQEQHIIERNKIKYLQKTIMKIEKGQIKKKQPLNQIAYEVHQIKKDQIMKKQQEEDIQQSQQYKFTERAHLQCLKTQFIFRQIVNPLLSTNQLNIEDRSVIELIYLLLARCFNNMSPIHLELEQTTEQRYDKQSESSNYSIIQASSIEICTFCRQTYRERRQVVFNGW